MPTDYVILAVVAVLSISGGLYVLQQARNYRRNRAERYACGNQLHKQ